MADSDSQPAADRPGVPPAASEVTRRGFLSKGVVALAGASAVAAAVLPLRHLDPHDLPSLEQFLQKHYKEMTPEDKEQVFERIAEAVQQRFGVEPKMADPPPLKDVEFVYGLNLSRCIGCRRCVHACVQENNQSRAPEIQYIRVLEMEKGSIDVESANHHYDPPTVPNPDKYYMPVQCHQCENPPCVKVCPVEATWQEPDGITVIDYDWCIGCRYCEAACPYWARRFNFAEPQLSGGGVEPGDGLPVQSAAAEGGDGKMHVLPAPDAGGTIAGVPGSLPDGFAQVRQCAGSEQRSGLHPAAQTRVRAEGGRGDDSTVLLLLRRAWQSLPRTDHPRHRGR